MKQYSIRLLNDFKQKYGVKGVSECVEGLLRKCPPFPEEQEIASKIGPAMADLESLLSELFKDFHHEMKD